MTRRVFHAAVPRSIWARGDGQPRTWRWWLTQLLLLPIRLLIGPFKLYVNVRSSMTFASVTVLLISIVSLNIVWGYPWSGMFSACVSLLIVGFVTSRLMRPKLELGFSLPRSTPAEQPFIVVTHAKNVGRLPAMDLSIGFRQTKRRRRKSKDGFSLRDAHPVSVIQPSQRIHRSGSIRFDHRGIQTLPDLVVTSMYPFHLFRWTQRFDSATTIAVTPKVLTGDEDELARALIDALGNWSHRLLAGDALDYTGSREYEVGMPVRRWDFSSWARLGRPIVREFQSPTIQMVTLVVDTSLELGQEPALLERVLSVAATAVNDLSRKSVRVGLFVTHAENVGMQVSEAGSSRSDSESLLIQLAEAEAATPKTSDEQIEQVVDQMRHTPLLVITARTSLSVSSNASSLTVLRIDSPEASSPAPSMRRRTRASDQANASKRVSEEVV